uniref:Uncharacterized protein n=1 Tax=Lepeophtheirus salmonis TaxID=72036 RepID=A0A0K2VDR9_LEPSM
MDNFFNGPSFRKRLILMAFFIKTFHILLQVIYLWVRFIICSVRHIFSLYLEIRYHVNGNLKFNHQHLLIIRDATQIIGVGENIFRIF